MTARRILTLPKCLAFFALAGCGASHPLHVYVSTLDEHSVTLAWGRASGTSANTIGYGATGMPAKVRIAGRDVLSERNWIHIDGLAPDTDYPYTVEINGAPAGSGAVHTWPAKSDSLTFFVIGDWGNASHEQYALARRMEEERRKRPVRFVLSTGDNIYGGGDRDVDWEKQFFTPYEETLRAIPFYAVPGNHDGNEEESASDLGVYLDNFFFPGLKPARWYKLQYAGLAEFFALDSTKNQPRNPPAPVYRPGDEESQWLNGVLREPALPWRIAVLHHPLFSAGPRHAPSFHALAHWFRAWRDNGVSVVFSGHEHNLQFSERNEETGFMQFLVSGAGGQLRAGNVRGHMRREQIAAWAPQNHFLVVEIGRDEMRITPITLEPLKLRDAGGRDVTIPIVVLRRK